MVVQILIHHFDLCCLSFHICGHLVLHVCDVRVVAQVFVIPALTSMISSVRSFLEESPSCFQPTLISRLRLRGNWAIICSSSLKGRPFSTSLTLLAVPGLGPALHLQWMAMLLWVNKTHYQTNYHPICVVLCCVALVHWVAGTAELTQIVTRMRITKPNQNEIQRNRSRSKQEGGCSYPAYYLRVWNSPLKVLKECKDPAINVVDKSPKPVNNEFETPAVADSAMESRSQPSPVIAKSKRQSADQSVRYKSLTIGIFFDIAGVVLILLFKKYTS